MSQATKLRYRQHELETRHLLLTRWLDQLPAQGWVGPVLSLEYALEAVRVAHADLKHRCHVPAGTGMGRMIADSEGLFRSLGWTVRISRSRKTGRTFVFERVKQPTEATA